MEHPVVRFYIMRYNQGKTKIPKQWEPMVMEALEQLQKEEEQKKEVVEQKEK